MKKFWIAMYVFWMTFAGISAVAACTPAGTAGDDTVACTGIIASYQYLYGGSDTVTLDHVSANTNGNVYWLDEAIGGNPLTDGNDTLIAHDSSFFWVLGFGGNDRFEVYDSNFSNLYGDTNPGHGTSQRGNDTIRVERSTSNGYVLGGNDNDIIMISHSTVSNVAGGYSDIYAGTDYSPFDGNDTIVLNDVNFTAPLYWDPLSIEGIVMGGRGNDSITFRDGGEAYYVYGGHGSDIITVYDGEHFNPCPSSSQDTARCGIYGDVSYASEQNVSAIPVRHGDDAIRLYDADLRQGYVQGGDGSDVLSVYTPVLLEGSTLDGGDDRSAADTFIDRVQFEHWMGDLNGSQFHNWEQIRLHDASMITWLDGNMSTGINGGIDVSSGLPYGLIIDDDSQLNVYHDFMIDGNLYNAAVVNLQDGNASGTVLRVKGDYTASSGEIYLDTVLNNAAPSLSDRLVVEGSSSGTSVLIIANNGGNGGQTPTGDDNGILVVEIHGDSNGTFVLNAPLQTADYWYRLLKGSNGNWYLQSEIKRYTLSLTKVLSVNADEDASGDITLGDTLSYTIAATNTGNTTLHQVLVSDPLTTPGSHTCATLAPQEHCVLEGNYSVTAANIDAGQIENTATVQSDMTEVIETKNTATTGTYARPTAVHDQNINITSYNPAGIDILANDLWDKAHCDLGKLTLTQPERGRVTLDDRGTPNDLSDDRVIYTPEADTNDVMDSFTYTITDCVGQTDSARVTLDIACASTQTSDSGDALTDMSIVFFAMILSILGFYFVRREARYAN